MKDITPEQRQSLATVLEGVASCLRSEKTIEECHLEMKKSCHENLGEEFCGALLADHGMEKKMRPHKPMNPNRYRE